MFVKHFLHIAGNHDRPLRIGTQIDHISDRIPCIHKCCSNDSMSLLRTRMSSSCLFNVRNCLLPLPLA